MGIGFNKVFEGCVGVFFRLRGGRFNRGVLRWGGGRLVAFSEVVGWGN